MSATPPLFRPDPTALLGALSDALVVVAANGSVSFATSAALVMFGGEDGRVRPSIDLVHPDDRASVFQAVQELRAGAIRAVRIAWRLRGLDGVYARVDTLASDERHDPRVAGFVVSTRVAAAAAPAEDTDTYSLAVRCAVDGFWDWDLTTDHLHLSPQWLETVGWHDTERVFTSEEWFESVHPADREGLMRAIRAHLDGHSDRLLSEHRILAGDGTYTWVSIRGVANRDGSGRAARLSGSMSDIAESKLTDALTGLPNSTLFMDRVARQIAASRVDPQSFAVLVLDIDRHAVVRESLGHAAGDQMLRHVARRIERTLRPGDTVARIGEARFGILVDSIRDSSDASRVSQRLHESLAEPIRVEGTEVFTTCSIGIALAGGTEEAPDDMVRAAETAMRRARLGSDDRSATFDRGMHQQAKERLRLETDLRRAVDRGGFELHYQPIVDLLAGGEVVGFEALIRWRDEERGLVSPVLFIPISEETGLIVPIGRWVLREACRQLHAWAAVHPGVDRLMISVNVSGREFDQADLADRVLATLADIGLSPTQLKLEITETAIMRNPKLAAATLQRLKRAGIKLALDDFGTGYSSLSYLHELPFDDIKIDRSFVCKIGADGQSPEIVRTIVSLARSLGMDCVAEGIETPEQERVLRELGCRFGQGWHFGRPEPAAQAADRLQRRAG